MAWNDGLNAEQQRAIEEPRSVSLIAGPGTGKTRTLLARALYAVEVEGIPPSRVRIANFTNAGVNDVKGKLAEDPRYAALDSEKVTTFHSLALRALRRLHAPELPDPLLILSEWAEEMFIDQYVKRSLGLPSVRNARSLRSLRDAAWCRAIRDFEAPDQVQAQFREAYGVAQSVLGFITRSEITYTWWKYLISNPAGIQDAAAAIEADLILVDEYQDLNECEHEIIGILARAGVRVFAVGDPNQSIYEELRHAHPEYCEQFPTRVSSGRVYYLRESYRCPSEVLAMGSALMSAHPGVPDPGLARTSGDARILNFPTGSAELNGIARISKAVIEHNPSASVLVCVPRWKDASDVVSMMQAVGVSCESMGSHSAAETDECRYAECLSRIMRDPRDSVAVASAIVLQTARTTRSERAVALIEYCHERSMRASDLLESPEAMPKPLERARETVARDLRRLQGSANVTADIREITGCRSFVERAPGDESAEPPPVASRIPEGIVTITTLFGSKGLEADWVFVPMVEPGNYEREFIGRSRAARRRLLYVGLTRAKCAVFLSYATQRTGRSRYADATGPSKYKGRSEFVDRIIEGTGMMPQAGGDAVREFARQAT